MRKDSLKGIKTLQVTEFLDEFEKDEVKKKVDITALFSSFGVNLEKKGKSFMGLCPFHADTNPSLSVDKEKGLFHCFGCGESGDVVDLVMKKEGIPFPEALARLKSFSGNGHKDIAGSPKKARQPRAPATPAEKAEKTHLVPESALSLDTVADYYHKTLRRSRNGVEYLEKRGIGSPEVIKRFLIGFSDGSLKEKLSGKQWEELTRAGIFGNSGREHFAGCVTVPLCDEQGAVVGLYGRKIAPKASLKHLYLPGPHQGLVNRKAIKVYREEIILTESVIDALSFVHLGIENVLPCYGTNGFTDEHLKALTDNRVKTVVVAFDVDAAGRKGASTLSEKLLDEGFSVKVIEPLKGKDWNEYLVGGGTGEEVKKLVGEADARRRVPTTPDAGWEVKKEGPKYLFRCGELRYRLVGVKEVFVSTLRVNIRAEGNDEKFIDNVDLYSARSRTAFSTALSNRLGVEAARVEKELVWILEYLEEERDKRLFLGETEKVVVTEEDERLGMELLTAPDLFDRIVEDTETVGSVGEEVNKQLLYIAASSRKLEDPISVLVISESAAGKSHLVETVKKLIPPEEVVSMTSLSDQALNYLPEEGLKHKFLVMGEAVHGEVVDHQLREMLSAKELSRLVTLKNPKTGELESRMVRKEVIVSAVLSSTNYEINSENASRFFLTTTDESEEQTKNIHKAQRGKYSLKRYREKEGIIPKIIKVHHAAQRLLTRRTIVNPFADLLAFPSSMTRVRRDHERFIDLIACVCFLRQFQKEEKEEAGIRYIECDLTDYRIAYGIMQAVLPSTLMNFPKSATGLYEEVRKLLRKKGEAEGVKAEEVSITQRGIREATGFSQMFVKRNIRILCEYEYLVSAGMNKRGSRGHYRLFRDEAIRLIDLSMLPAPEAMERKLK